MLSLARLLVAAARHPLYRDWDFSLVEEFTDAAWRRLPSLTREHLRQNEETRPAASEILFHSSGTTGAPSLVRFGPEDLGRVGELCARFARLEGVSGRSRVMVLLPMGLWTAGKITVEGHRRVGAEVFPVDLHGGVEAWQRMADLIRPSVISSTPSVLAAWAPHYRGPRLELVETTGEPLLIRDRHLIEARFGGFVLDAYGLSECVVGTECPVRAGFHYWPDATGVEVLALDSDTAVPDGEPGELVLTSFMQERMPVLRLRSGDRGRIERTLCPCGHEGPRAYLEGRIADTLALPRAVQLDAAELAGLLAEIAPGARFRYKGTPGSPAAPFLEGRFRPVLEIAFADREHVTLEDVRRELLAAFPDLAELVHEQELDVYIAPDTQAPCREGLQ